MARLEEFHANGVSFPDVSRQDVHDLLERIPAEGALHLAILQQPYLDLIPEGTKTIESRFNTKRAAPFGKVAVGDLVLLKGSGRPVTNYFFAASAASIDLREVPIEEVRRQYAEGICAQDYCTLVEVGERGAIPPLSVIKRDQRGWVTFSRTSNEPQTLF